jgi:nucleoside-diphosphate-sugar epimerase
LAELAVRILLTGGSGFVGSHILKHLTTYEDVSIDTLSKNMPRNIDRYSRVENIYGNLEDKSTLSILKLKRYDVLIHAAWKGLPSREPELNNDNYSASRVLFESFIEAGGKAIVGIGSCLEYGNAVGNVRENSKSNELGHFGETKAKLRDELSRMEIPYLWFRPFYLFGLNQHPNSLLNATLKNRHASNNTWLQKSNEAHDYVYVEDFGRIVSALIKEGIWIKELNVGTSETYTNLEFVNMIRKELNLHEYRFEVTQSDCMKADINKLKKALPNFQFMTVSRAISEICSNLKSDNSETQ